MKTLAILCNFVVEIASNDWLNRLAIRRPGRYSLRCDDGSLVAASDESCRALCDAAGSLWVDGGQVKARWKKTRPEKPQRLKLTFIEVLELWNFRIKFFWRFRIDF